MRRRSDRSGRATASRDIARRWRRGAFAAAVLVSGCASHAAAQEPTPGGIDLLAFSNGGLVERSATAYGGGWEAIWLIDEDPAHGWASQKGVVGTAEFVFSLPERSRLESFAFGTASVEQPDEAARDVAVLVSDQSATEGFVPAGAFTLAEAEDGQSFALQHPAVGRWVKVIVRTNYGSADYIELMDVHAYGVPLTTMPGPNVSGTYASEAYGRFHLAQAGAQLDGCDESKNGLVQGGLDGHLMRLVWSENAGTDSASGGPVVMVLNRDGHGFQGLWKATDGAWNDNWKLRKISDQVGSCPHWKPVGAGVGTIVASSLAAQGRVRLYGINFDTDSDILRPDARPALDQLVAALRANAGRSVTIEGHTDSSSTPAHNLDLSRRRAIAVQAYLSRAGVTADHLDAVGYGQDKPVAGNDTALGRAQNRRVEVVRR